MEQGKLFWLTILLWFVLGQFGIHRFYLGYKKSAITMLALTLVGWATIVIAVGFVFLFAVGIWLLVDLILILTKKLKPADGTQYV